MRVEKTDKPGTVDRFEMRFVHYRILQYEIKGRERINSIGHTESRLNYLYKSSKLLNNILLSFKSFGSSILLSFFASMWHKASMEHLMKIELIR